MNGVMINQIKVDAVQSLLAKKALGNMLAVV